MRFSWYIPFPGPRHYFKRGGQPYGEYCSPAAGTLHRLDEYRATGAVPAGSVTAARRLRRGTWPGAARPGDAGPATRPSSEVGDPDVNSVGWDVLLVLAVVCIGGFFAAAEMALVSLREGQVRSLARRGRRGQRAARLAQDPNRFLSSVQIGVTLATLLSGAFGAALLSDRLSDELSRWMPRG